MYSETIILQVMYLKIPSKRTVLFTVYMYSKVKGQVYQNIQNPPNM
jgi:hypothetical protein